MTSFGSASFWVATHETWSPSLGQTTEESFPDDGDSEKAFHLKERESNPVDAMVAELPTPMPIHSPACQ